VSMQVLGLALNRSDAEDMYTSLWKPIAKHLMLIAVWGPKPHWIAEVFTWASDLSDIRLKPRNRHVPLRSAKAWVREPWLTMTEEVFRDRVRDLARRKGMRVPEEQNWPAWHQQFLRLQEELLELICRGEVTGQLLKQAIKEGTK